MARAPKKPTEPTVVGEAGPEVVELPADAEIIPAAELEEVVNDGTALEALNAELEEVVNDGTALEALNIAAAPAAPPAPVAEPDLEAEAPRELGKYDGYPIGVFVGVGVTETVIGDLGAYTVDPTTGCVTAAA